ncbi:phosphatase PAP2 family protein [Laribacter hongkongensis]|uniref:phosphatase PAP2 family protein n=1 Tax=Laribacter hongkongensis TaxID=168471 RepID=UPI001EFD17A1|nr:phosphatase PAP2 family protein [Laribacter hongkongensis]MCG9076845.1 phosphatase PAP2 family protein [Laribacter hongkongensis]
MKWIVAWVLCLLALTLWHGSAPVAAVDQAAAAWLGSLGAPWPQLAQLWDVAGKFAPTLALAGAVAGWLVWRRRRRAAALVLGAVAGGWMLNGALKLWIGRPRPSTAAVTEVFGSSFPSGHAMGGTALWVALALVCLAGCRSVPARRAVLAAAVVLVVLTALSRPVLGVHYFSDVLAGVAGGLALTLWLARIWPPEQKLG